MNICTSKHELTVEVDSDQTENRLKLNTSGFRFLAVHVVEGKVIAVFEENTYGNSVNQSYFVHKVGGEKRFRPGLEALAGFVLNGEIYHLYGASSNQR